jgi:hypothetical protein
MRKQKSIYGGLSANEIYALAGTKTRRCTICALEKAPVHFGVDRNRSGGLAISCKECNRIGEESDNMDPEKRKAIDARHHKKRKNTIERKYTVYKSAAKKHKRTFSLSIEDFKLFWKKPCTYCGDEIETIGLDRIDSSIGYELDNITSCCLTCNKMKINMPIEDWYNKMIKVLKFKGKI